MKSAEADAKRHVNHYLLSAMLHTPRFCAPYASFVTIPSTQRICHSERMKDFGPLDRQQTVPLSKADFNAIDNLCPVVSHTLSTGSPGRLPTAIRYYQQAFRADIDWSVRFLGMMMAMESLFSHGASEVSHQVSERTAFFVMSDSRDRETLYEEMRTHYKLRSTIAHGGTAKKRSQDMTKGFGDLLMILRSALIKIFGDPALTSIFESANTTQFNRALRNLVFRGEIALHDE